MRMIDTNVPKAKRMYGANNSNPIKKFLLYAGLSREEYFSIRQDFVRSNKVIMTVVSIVVIVFMSAMTVFSFMTDNPGIISSRYVYIISLLFPFATLAIGRFGNSYSIVYVGVYLFSIFAVCGGIAMGVLGSNNNLSVSFMVIILVVPILFFGCPLRKMFFILASLTAFLITVFCFKSGETLEGDVINAFLYSGLSIPLSIYTTVINAKVFINGRKLIRLRNIDPLTDLGNRYSYDEYIEELNKNENIDGVTVFILDIDDLKTVNDTNGHLVGDKIIKGAAECITSVFSSYGKCFRIGGDEFCVIVEKRLLDAYEILEQLKGSVLAWSTAHGNILSISCGYASSIEVSKKIVHELVKKADEQMYANKRSNEYLNGLNYIYNHKNHKFNDL